MLITCNWRDNGYVVRNVPILNKGITTKVRPHMFCHYSMVDTACMVFTTISTAIWPGDSWGLFKTVASYNKAHRIWVHPP